MLSPGLYSFAILGHPKTLSHAHDRMIAIVASLRAMRHANPNLLTAAASALDPKKHLTLPEATNALEAFLSAQLPPGHMWAWDQKATGPKNATELRTWATQAVDAWMAHTRPITATAQPSALARQDEKPSATIVAAKPTAPRFAAGSPAALLAKWEAMPAGNARSDFLAANQRAIFQASKDRGALAEIMKRNGGSEPSSTSPLGRFKAYRRMPVGDARLSYFSEHESAIRQGARDFEAATAIAGRNGITLELE